MSKWSVMVLAFAFFLLYFSYNADLGVRTVMANDGEQKTEVDVSLDK